MINKLDNVVSARLLDTDLDKLGEVIDIINDSPRNKTLETKASFVRKAIQRETQRQLRQRLSVA